LRSRRYVWPAIGVAQTPLGDAFFLKLVKMLIAQVIFLTGATRLAAR